MQRDRSGVAPGQSRRRVLGGAAAGALGLAAAACGPATGGGSGGNQAAPSKGPVTIEVLTRNGVASPTGHSQFYDQRAKKLFTPETGITVNLVDAQPDVGEKLTVMAAGGSLPDGSWFGVVADGNAGREQANRGIFKPLDDLAKKDSKFDLKPYFKSMLDAFNVDGKLYALPTHAHYGTHVLYYNKNLTDAAGRAHPGRRQLDAGRVHRRGAEAGQARRGHVGLLARPGASASSASSGCASSAASSWTRRARSCCSTTPRPAPASSGSTTPRPSSR